MEKAIWTPEKPARFSLNMLRNTDRSLCYVQFALDPDLPEGILKPIGQGKHRWERSEGRQVKTILESGLRH